MVWEFLFSTNFESSGSYQEVLVIFYLVGGISLAKKILVWNLTLLFFHFSFFLYVSSKFYCKETALKKLQKKR